MQAVIFAPSMITWFGLPRIWRPQMSQFKMGPGGVNETRPRLNRFAVLHEAFQLIQKATWRDLRKLRGIANYQFGKELGNAVFKRSIELTRSRKTGKIRHIFRDGKLIATLRARDGFLALTPHGADVILRVMKDPPRLVTVRTDVADFIKAGRSVFAKHVLSADSSIHPQDEVMVVDEKRELLAVGRAILAGSEMTQFKRGIAVKTRRGVETNRSKPS
jgi:predicted RNA-binding protein (TIGR00451 family)